MKPQDLQDTAGNLSPKEGGRTALHMACMRESDHRVSASFTIRRLPAHSHETDTLSSHRRYRLFQNASKVVALLLSHSASTDLLWSGHSPLSLAIATGNERVNLLISRQRTTQFVPSCD